MQGSMQRTARYQRGVSLSGLIFSLAVIAMIAVVAMKVFPTFVEYRAIKDGIAMAKTATSTVEIENSFSKSAEINSVTSITAKDLIISREGGEVEISFAYERRIPLFGPVSLVIDYAGTTAKGGVVPPKTPQ